MSRKPPNDPAWKRLGELLVRRRLDLGWRHRSQFARDKDLRDDRILTDIENGKRSNYEPSTLINIERIYEWGPGSIANVLGGGLPIVDDVALSTPPVTEGDLLRDIRTASELWRSASAAREAGEESASRQLAASAEILITAVVRRAFAMDTPHAAYIREQLFAAVANLEEGDAVPGPLLDKVRGLP